MKNYLLLHGALGSATDFDHFIPLWNTLHKLKAIDLPFHGKNASDKAFTLDSFSDYLVEYIEAHYDAPISVFGYSMGGYVALLAAGKKPSLFEQIITFATKYHWNNQIVTRQASMLDAKMIEEKNPAFVEKLKQTHINISWHDLLAKTIKMMQDISDKKYLDKTILSNISCKVLCGVGDKDKMVSIDETINTAQSLPNGNFFVLPNTTHPLEKLNGRYLSVYM